MNGAFQPLVCVDHVNEMDKYLKIEKKNTWEIY